MKKYKAGFSLEGLLGSLLVILPNIIWAIVPPANDVLSENSVEIPALDLIMNVCRIALITLLIVVVNKTEGESRGERRFLVPAALSLLAYYVSWVMFYAGVTNPWLFILGLATAPSLFFILLALGLSNKPALVPGAVFAVLHIAVTAIGFL